MISLLPRSSSALRFSRGNVLFFLSVLAYCFLALACLPLIAEESAKPAGDAPSKQASAEPVNQSELDAAFIKMLSGSVLDGSFTKTGPGDDPTRVSREKYTIGDVRKLAGDLWLIPARIQYGQHDLMLPVTVPIRWAGDTPVIVVDNLGLPVFGTVSARVMFFDDHYAGYWKHGKHGGHLFGVIRRDEDAADEKAEATTSLPASGSDKPAVEQNDQQRGQK